MVFFIINVEVSVFFFYYCWNVSKFIDEWFVDEEKVWRIVGVLEGRGGGFVVVGNY